MQREDLEDKKKSKEKKENWQRCEIEVPQPDHKTGTLLVVPPLLIPLPTTVGTGSEIHQR